MFGRDLNPCIECVFNHQNTASKSYRVSQNTSFKWSLDEFLLMKVLLTEAKRNAASNIFHIPGVSAWEWACFRGKSRLHIVLFRNGSSKAAMMAKPKDTIPPKERKKKKTVRVGANIINALHIFQWLGRERRGKMAAVHCSICREANSSSEHLCCLLTCF